MINLVRSFLSLKTAAAVMLAIIAALLFFHLLVIFSIIPYEIVWGGRLTSAEEMYVFESVSVSILLFLFLLILIRMGKLLPSLSEKARHVFWLFVFLFLLNTVGNLASLTPLETIIFTPVTLVLAVFSWRLALR